AIEAAACAIAVNRGEQNFAGAALDAFARPSHRVLARGLRAATHEDGPGAAFALHVHRKHHRLRTELPRQLRNQLRALDRRRIHGHFIRPRAQHGLPLIERTNSAARRQRNAQLSSDATDRIEKGRAAFARGADIENYQFVGAFAVVARRQRLRIADIAEALEFNSLDDAAGIHIETRDDAARERHRDTPRKFRSTCAPASPDFSGWNCTASRFPRSITAANSAPWSQTAALASQ